jgi:hypothetical protein
MFGFVWGVAQQYHTNKKLLPLGRSFLFVNYKYLASRKSQLIAERLLPLQKGN